MAFPMFTHSLSVFYLRNDTFFRSHSGHLLHPQPPYLNPFNSLHNTCMPDFAALKMKGLGITERSDAPCLPSHKMTLAPKLPPLFRSLRANDLNYLKWRAISLSEQRNSLKINKRDNSLKWFLSLKRSLPTYIKVEHQNTVVCIPSILYVHK